MAVSFSCSPVAMRSYFPPTTKPRVPNPTASIQMGRLHGLGCFATSREAQDEVEDRKCQLLSVIQDTHRGLVTTTEKRSSIEEALVSVEGFDAGHPIDLAELNGTWRLQYTSASDVLILLESAARLPFFQIGQIFQKFECGDEPSRGIVRNIVKWSITNFLEEQEGATLLVSAKFSVISLRNIYLQFEEVEPSSR